MSWTLGDVVLRCFCLGRDELCPEKGQPLQVQSDPVKPSSENLVDWCS